MERSRWMSRAACRVVGALLRRGPVALDRLGFALIASIKFHSAQFLADSPWLAYGRVRAAYQNALLYGFCLPAGLGVGAWLFARLGEGPAGAAMDGRLSACPALEPGDHIGCWASWRAMALASRQWRCPATPARCSLSDIWRWPLECLSPCRISTASGSLMFHNGSSWPPCSGFLGFPPRNCC